MRILEKARWENLSPAPFSAPPPRLLGERRSRETGVKLSLEKREGVLGDFIFSDWIGHKLN